VSDMAEKIKLVASMYDNDTWRTRVQGMDDAQIIAIYLRFIANPVTQRPETPEALDKELNESEPRSYNELRLF
jgi:hypothetical protein